MTDSTGASTATLSYDVWGVTTTPAPTNTTAAANREPARVPRRPQVMLPSELWAA